MKQILLTLALICCLCSCNRVTETTELQKLTIVDCYVNDFGHKVFVMSDGGMTEVIPEKQTYPEYLRFSDKEFNNLYPFGPYICEKPNLYRWLNAEIGDTVVLKQEKLEEGSRVERRYFYDIQITPDYSVQRKIARITKYDGNFNKMEGAVKLQGGLLSGTSGSGHVNEEGMASQNMFINIYFEERAPICVNAKENQLWLDVEAGDTIIEKRINGKLLFLPKF